MSAMRPYYVEYLYRDICLKFHTARSRTKHSVLLYNVIYKKSISQYFFFVLWNSSVSNWKEIQVSIFYFLFIFSRRVLRLWCVILSRLIIHSGPGLLVLILIMTSYSIVTRAPDIRHTNRKIHLDCDTGPRVSWREMRARWENPGLSWGWEGG